jgi:alpha/beta superfamily hydrolase
MPEESIVIQCGDLHLEGLLENHPGEKGVVVTHPHPLYGGEMRNNVVEAVIQAFREMNYSTLRFNFRGVGGSEGSYDNGVGEQEDVRAALQYLTDLGKKPIDLAGYSFGAWVDALGLETFGQVSRLIMVSPPIGLLDFESLVYNPKVQLVIGGSHDDIADVKIIEEKMPTWNPDAILRIIQGADHFYWGKAQEIKAIIQEFLDQK